MGLNFQQRSIFMNLMLRFLWRQKYFKLIRQIMCYFAIKSKLSELFYTCFVKIGTKITFSHFFSQQYNCTCQILWKKFLRKLVSPFLSGSWLYFHLIIFFIEFFNNDSNFNKKLVREMEMDPFLTMNGSTEDLDH